MIHSDDMFGNGVLTLGNLDFNAALEASGRPAPDRSFLNAAIDATDINQDAPRQLEPVVNPMQRLTDVCLYDEDEEAAERVKNDVLVTEIARGAVFGQNMLIGVELADMYAGGDVYETAQRFIGALPREQQQAWRDKLDHCQTQGDGQALVGEMYRQGVVEQYRTNKAKQEALEEERGLAFNGVFSELVKDGNNEEAWNRFREGQARGAFTDADKKALDSAAKAWGMMEILMGDYTRSGAAVLMDAESGERIFNELYGDEMAQAVFLNVLQNEVQDLKNDASRRNALERFGRAFAASTNNLMAGVIGGKFKAFVTDEQVDEYNREWVRARELSGRENPNVAVYAEGDNWVEKYLLPGNARIDAIRKAAQESGQMNQDGSLRKMTAEERKGTQELGAFRGGLFNAVQGMYDVPGVVAKLGKMMPDSMIYLVPGGMFASAGSMHTQELARRLGKGEDYVSANTKAAVEAGISAAVEKLAFGSLKPTRMAPGLDWLMSRKVVGQALGKIYGSTAGRIGLGVAAGAAEETFAEPLAGLIMRGVYNVAAADELQLADPLGTYRKEMEEMLAPDQILVTGLYGLLLGGVSAGGHMQAAEDYREMYEHLVSIGVDEGRAAQAARDDEAVAGFKATKALFDEAMKKDTKGVIAYLAELYPHLEPLNVAENLFSTWQLPHLVPAENGQVKVQEQDEDGKVTETLMSKEAADLLVQARLEQMKSSEIAKFANQLLGVAMAGKASTESDRFVVEEVDGAMDVEYFTRLANAAGVRLQQGARADEVDPEIHQHLTLGQLVQQGKAWEQRMEIQRNEVDQERAKKNLPPLTDEEWTERKKNYVAAVNRQSVRGADGRKRTLLRVSRGNYGAMNVLEDLTEDFVARDMQANNRGLEWYVQNIRELETALGRQNEFLRELGEGKKPLNQMDVIEAVGKIAQSKLLADTVKGEHGFSAALKSFLEMIRTLMLKAAAMLKLGKAINQALSDEQVREKMDADFLQLVDDVVAQDIEYLRELQLEDGLKAMQRVIAARQQAKADTRVKRRRKAQTPVLDKAEKNHGKKVREAARKKRRQQARVDADVDVAEAALEGDFSSSVVNQEELDAIKAAAEKDGTFMKAPNGEPTRLTEQQWLQVRTKAFKMWFGDWENVSLFRVAYNRIMSMESVASLSGREFGRGLTPEKMTEHWQTVCGGKVKHDVLGEVVLTKRSAKDCLAHGLNREKIAVFAKVHEVIRLGVIFDRQSNWKQRGYDTCCLAAPVAIDGKEYVCQVVVKQFKDRNQFYLHEVELKEKLPTEGRTGFYFGSTSGGANGLLAQKAEEVNAIWENCSKIVDANGEPLVVYHGTPTGGFTIFRDESYFSPLMWYAEKYKNPAASSNRSSRDVGTPMIYEVFLNIRKPFDTRNAAEKKIFETDFFRKWGNGAPLSERGLPDWTDATDLLEFIEENELDYDGLILDEGGYPDGNGGVILRGHSFVPVTPNQIKSSTDNRGTFDGSSPDITFSVVGEHAANWEKIKDRAFTGRDDGKLRVELQRKHELTLNQEQTTQAEAIKHLEELEGQPLVNTRSGFVAFVNKPQRKELVDLSKAWKSATNGFSVGAHYEAVSRIEKLFEHAVPCGEYEDKKNGDKQVVIHRFACPLMIRGEKAVAWMTAKQTTNVEGSERLYNVELVDIEKLAGNLENLASHRLQDDLPAASKDIVAKVEEAFKTYFEDVPESDSSPSIINMDEESVAREVVDAGQGFRANLAYSEAIMREMRGAMQRLRRLGSKTRTDREDAVAAMGTMVQMVKAAVAVLPKGYRFSVHPYLNRIEALAELAATGDIDLTSDIAGKDILQLENAEGVDLKKPYDEMVKEYGNVKLAEALERIMHRVSEQLRKHAKDRAVEKITELVERLAPKKDPKTGKLKGGKMSADAYRDLEDAYKAMLLSGAELDAAIAAKEAELNAPGLSEEQRSVLESELAIYSQFGDLDGMSAEEAVAAYEALRMRILMHRFEWDNIMAERRHERRKMVHSVVSKVGEVRINRYNEEKRMKKPTKRTKRWGDMLSSATTTIFGMRNKVGLRGLADNLLTRATRAGELVKQCERERWMKLEALSLETIGKSWRESMADILQVNETGVRFERPKFREVSLRVDELRELLTMTYEEREADRKQREKDGGVLGETILTEQDVQELGKELARMERVSELLQSLSEGERRAEIKRMREAGETVYQSVLKVVKVDYIEGMQVEENLKLSKNEALYAILMYEQPTYTERMEAQGYTPEVIDGLKKYIGDGVLQFGYGLREMFAQQGDRIAAVYENAFGVPFPREENYFAARWNVTERKGSPEQQLLASMTGTPGAGKGWQKQRVQHNLKLDMTKGAVGVFLQATQITDTWMATQDIISDFNAWTRDERFDAAMNISLGADGYQNLKDWIDIMETGGVKECVNMGASQDVINGLYGSSAVAILGWRLQTLLKQTPAIFNGLLGAHDISTAEWMATLAKMKHGEAPMSYSRMLNSELIQNRMQGKFGAMAGQALRSGDIKSSKMEDWLLAAMLPMEKVDARCTAIGLVPVWNVYYARAIAMGATHEMAEQSAWEQTAIAANLASQPVGWLNKSKISQHRNPLIRSFFHLLSENMSKFSMCRDMWQGGHKGAAFRAWMIYGAANTLISALLDCLQGDPEEWEKAQWWEYLPSLLYGPAGGMPFIGEVLSWVGTGLILNLPGYLLGNEEMQKARSHAGVARSIVDMQGAWNAGKKIVKYLTDDKDQSFAEYTREASKFSRTLAVGTGWMMNGLGYFSTLMAVITNPIDLGARIWRNATYESEE